MLGAIPLGLGVVAINVFVGPAKLAPIPEGYDPKPHEYYRVSGNNFTKLLYLFQVHSAQMKSMMTQVNILWSLLKIFLSQMKIDLTQMIFTLAQVKFF